MTKSSAISTTSTILVSWLQLTVTEADKCGMATWVIRYNSTLVCQACSFEYPLETADEAVKGKVKALSALERAHIMQICHVVVIQP